MGGAEGMGGSFGHGAFWGGRGGDLNGENEHSTALVHGRKGGGFVEGNRVAEVDRGGESRSGFMRG